MLDKKIFLKGMTLLGAAFDKEVNEALLEVYWMDLKDFDPKDFERVVTNHRRTAKFFPKISELREELVRLKGFHRPTASDAWDDLLRAAETGEKPELDEITEKALSVCGGWDNFQFMSYHDLQFRRKDFLTVYNDGLERQDRQIKLGHDVPERLRIAEKKALE